MLRVAIISDETSFLGLTSAWNDVARQSAPGNVFVRHEWLAAAWAWRRFDSSLNVLAVEDQNRTIGFLPLIRIPETRQLAYLSVPDTQFADVIALPSYGARVGDALAAHLAANRDWDAFQIGHLRHHGYALTALVPALARLGIRIEMRDGGRNPYVNLSKTWSSYYSERSRSLKKANNLAGNRLRKAGVLDIEWLAPGSNDQSACQRALESCVAISGRSWKTDTGNSLDQPGPNAFLRALTTPAFTDGWLSIWTLRLDGRPIAMEYQLIYAGQVHALRADFDSSVEDLSPGSHLFRHLLEDLFGQSLDRYYMGPGENPYKKRWTDQAEPLTRMVAYSRSFRGQMLWLRDAILKPHLRAIRDRLRKAPQSKIPKPSLDLDEK